MTNEKTLAEVLRIQEALTEENTPFAQYICAELVRALSDEINAQTAKKGGKKEAQAAAMRILKTVDEERHPHLAKALTAADGAQILCDGYRLVKLPEGLPLPEHTEPELIQRGREFVPNAEKLLSNAAGNLGENKPAPDLSTVKNFIAIEKAKAAAHHSRLRQAPFEIIPGGWCDALLLVDLLQIFNAPVMRFSVADNWQVQPIYFEAANGCALLLPMRKPAGVE